MDSITIGQLIDYFEREFPTARQQQQQALFGITVQGADSVGSYYTKLKKIARLANMGDDEFRRRFIGGLTSENQLEVRRMGLHKPINEILSTLEEIERYKTELATGINPTLQVQPPPPQTFTSADIDRIVNEKIQAMQRPYISSQPASIPAPAPPPAPDPEYAAAHHKLLALARRLGMNQYQISGASVQEIEVFIDRELLANLPQNHDYHANINMHITRVNNTFGDEYEALKRSYATGTSRSRKCSNCGKTGHTKGSCPKSKKGKKKGKKKTNYAHDSSSSSESSSSDSDSSDSDSNHTCYGLKKKSSEREHSGKKVKDKRKSHADRRLIIFEVFQLFLKALVQSFVNTVPKETVISVYNALNAEFINYKDPILNQLKGSPSIKTREKIWDSIKELFTVILQPMIGIVSSNMAANLIRKNEESGSVHVDDGLWMPAGIGVVNRKSASDVVTIKTKVVAPESEKSLVIPTTIFDTGSDSSLISNNIVKRLDLTVDKNNAPDLSGVATKSDTIGTVYGLGILVYDGENTKKIEDDFMVVKSDRDFLLLGVPWIDRANAILDFRSRQLTIPLTQRKKVTIPISLHKRKTNVTSLNIDSIDIKKICTLEVD